VQVITDDRALDQRAIEMLASVLVQQHGARAAPGARRQKAVHAKCRASDEPSASEGERVMSFVMFATWVLVGVLAGVLAGLVMKRGATG